PQLRRTHDAIRDTDPDHEESRCRVAQKNSVPLEPLDIVFGDALPPGVRVARECLPHIQAVALLLQRFYRVHALGSFPNPGASDASGILSGTVRALVTGLASQYNPPTNTPPPMTLPAMTQSWFQANPVQEMFGSCGRNKASPRSDWLAMLCSNPLPINANRHQKISSILAASPVARD